MIVRMKNDFESLELEFDPLLSLLLRLVSSIGNHVRNQRNALSLTVQISSGFLESCKSYEIYLDIHMYWACNEHVLGKLRSKFSELN